MFSASRSSTGAFSCSLPPGNAVKGGNVSKLVVFTLVLLRQKFHWWKQLGGACYFSPVKLGVRVFRKRAMPGRIGDCSWSPRCSRLPQCLVQISESCSSGPLCCPWQIHAYRVGWSATEGQWSSVFSSAQGTHSCLCQKAWWVCQPAGSVARHTSLNLQEHL